MGDWQTWVVVGLLATVCAMWIGLMWLEGESAEWWARGGLGRGKHGRRR